MATHSSAWRGSTRGVLADVGSTTHPETRSRRGPDPGECYRLQMGGFVAGPALQVGRCGRLIRVANTVDRADYGRAEFAGNAPGRAPAAAAAAAAMAVAAAAASSPRDSSPGAIRAAPRLRKRQATSPALLEAMSPEGPGPPAAVAGTSAVAGVVQCSLRHWIYLHRCSKRLNTAVGKGHGPSAGLPAA